MCFNRLPIEFDEAGTPRLAPGGWHGVPEPSRPLPSLPETGDGTTELEAEPLTRVAGALDFHAWIDLDAGAVEDARVSGTAFRGYEVLLKGRDPREAMEISSRVCGVCGGVHSTTASMAMDMAFPVVPPPLGTLARNIAQAAEVLYDHTLHLCVLAGPDYSRETVRRTEPGVWREAEDAPAPNSEIHGFGTIGDLMAALDPFSGALYRDAFRHTRAALKIVEAMVGSYPHPTTMVPGGINVLLTAETFEEVRERARQLLDPVKRILLAWDDLMGFFDRLGRGYRRCGARPAHLLCCGRYDRVDVYDGDYGRIDDWASARSIPPGVVVDGELRTTSLQAVNLGIEEFVDHSYYERWRGDAVQEDPSGAPLSPYHPWNKETLPKPEGRNWRERYTWATAPRWDREVVETGPIARNWLLAAAGDPDAWEGRLGPRGDAVEFTLPAGESLPELRLEWSIPERVNALERNRARAYHLGITWLQVHLDLERSLRFYRRGERRVWSAHEVPDEGIGAGFWEAARGGLGHWLRIEDGVVANYQIITPSAFNASPRDPWSRPGPYEEAALNTPILEAVDDEDEFVGIDLMRSVRSFDPCMPCAVHMDTGRSVVTREVVSCGCGAE